MRGIRFWLISIVSFIIATFATVFVSGSFLNRAFSVAFCTILSFKSTFCTPNLWLFSEKMMAANPSTIEINNNPLDNITYLTQQQRFSSTNADNPRAISSTTPEGCNIVLNTKNIDGKPFPDYVEYIGNDKKSCGNSFTSRVNPNGNGVTVIEDTKNGTVKHQVQNKPGRGIQIISSYPDGKTKTYTGGFSGRKYRFTYDDGSGKSETYTVDIPSNLESNLPRGTDSGNGNKSSAKESESSFCGTARRFCKTVDDMSTSLAYTQIAIMSYSGIFSFGSLLLLEVLPVLALVDLGFLIYGSACVGLVGGLQVIPSVAKPYGKALELLGPIRGRGVLDDAARKAYDGLVQEAAKQASLGNKLDEIRDTYGVSAPCKEKKEKEEKEDPCKSENNQNREECKLKVGKSYGDPHIATFDGMRYSFQTVGEFILSKSNDGAFEVQTRQAPVRSSLSLNSAVALKVGSNRVALYSKDFPDADTSTPLRINGKPTTIQGDKLTLSGGGEILKQGNTYVVNFSTGEKVVVSPISTGGNSYFNVSPFVYNRSGEYSGLLGNVNGNPKDDQQIRGKENSLEPKSTYGDVKQVLNQVGLRLPGALDRAEQVYFDQLYKEFGNSWRVKQEETLFDYPAGKTTKNYLDASFPNQYLKLNMLSSDQIQQAQTACTEAQVTQDLMEGCIFDVGFSGFSEFARATAEINGYIGIVNQLFPSLNIPTPERAVEGIIEKVKPRICLPIVGCR